MIPGMRKRVRFNRTFRLVITSVIITTGVVFGITLYLFPKYSELWILFLYTMPSEFLIGVIPQEPIILYYSKSYHPFTVTLVTLLATIFTEYLNYRFVTLLFKIPKLDDLKRYQTFQNSIYFFLSMPFLSLVIAAITPVPFFPLRIIVPVSRYSVKKYLIAILLGRTPRFYILAYFGNIVVLSDKIIILLFFLLLILLVISWIRIMSKKNKLKVKDYYF